MPGTNLFGEPDVATFEFSQLPLPLRDVASRFAEVAIWMVENLEPSELRAQGMWDLLRSRDCAVRAKKTELSL